MNRYKLAGLSLAGGILTGMAWTGWCTGLILLISFVPFFIIENLLFRNPGRYTQNAYFLFLLPGMVVFNIIALGWVRVVSIAAAVCIILGLSSLMSFTLWLAHIVHKRSGNAAGNIAVVMFWLSFEYLCLNTDFLTPGLNLGNGLAKDIQFIQWYEITGTSGGTLWILCSNILLSSLLINPANKGKNNRILLIIWIVIITIPVIISVIRYNTISQNTTDETEVVIIQPDIDPYTEKFSIPFDNQLDMILNMAEGNVTDKTRWLITPETTIDDPVNLDDMADNKYIRRLKDFASSLPELNIVSGMVTYKIYPPSPVAPTFSAKKTDKTGFYYDHYNSAILINNGKSIGIYHKSKLVPGVEMQFSNSPARFVYSIVPYLGGTKWGYGIHHTGTLFEDVSGKFKIEPVICYESAFGEYITRYVKGGACAIFIITNDGWWKNTTGYKQHLYLSSLRAIETRRQVVRTANTGVSCITDIRGKIIKKTGWWEKSVLKGTFRPENKITFYVKHGDYIMLISLFFSIILCVSAFIFIPLRKKFRKTGS